MGDDRGGMNVAAAFSAPLSRIVLGQGEKMGLYIFDKDGTLVQKLRTRVGKKRSAEDPEEQVLIEGAFEKIARLRRAGHRLAIASNQTSVARGIITYRQAAEIMQNCADKVGGVDAWRFSPFDPKAKLTLKGKNNPYAREDPSRKPNPGMVLDLMKELGCTPKDTVMVGDSDIDKKAAKNAGVRFIKAKKFFKKGKK